jgi:hypothetical protein
MEYHGKTNKKFGVVRWQREKNECCCGSEGGEMIEIGIYEDGGMTER